jgi:hypothetical protein
MWPDCDHVPGGGVPGSFNISAPAEAVVLKGDYTMANISSVADIHINVVPCAEGTWVGSVTFQANSAQANLTTGDGTFGPYHVGNTFTTNGYWDLQNNSAPARSFNVFLDYEQQQASLSPTAAAFTPGMYTVAIEDMWGQAVILHFVVK